MPDHKDEIEKLKDFYDNVYYKDTGKPHAGLRHLRHLASTMQVQKEQHILDIACGLGEWLTVCSDRGAKVYGIDLSETAINRCQASIPKGVFHAQPAEKLPFSDNAFDVVTCLGSLEHFVNPVTALKEMVRVGKSDATFLILVPNADFLTRKLKLYAGTNQKDAKEVVRTLEEWDYLFNQAGLKVSKKWKDLHVLSWHWVSMNGWLAMPLRTLQALALAVWPLKWQYQVYHLCYTNHDRPA